jgi:hypothetical protein
LGDVTRTLVYVLVAEFQGYCRDLIVEGGDFVADCAMGAQIEKADDSQFPWLSSAAWVSAKDAIYKARELIGSDELPQYTGTKGTDGVAIARRG